MAEQTESEVVRDLAMDALKPVEVEAGSRYVWRDPDATDGVVELDLSRETPAFKEGVVTVRDVASFKTYWDRHSDSDSEVFADHEHGRFTAVLDAHHANRDSGGERDPGKARWQQHHLVLALELTEPWKTWTKSDRTFAAQVTFAEFLEDNYSDLAPKDACKELDFPPVDAATFLEVASHLQATQRLAWKEGVRLDNGDIKFGWDEDTQARGGIKGDLEVPSRFALAIAPYLDCDVALIPARFRFRQAQGGGLTLGYFLNQPERVRRAAVEEIGVKVAEVIGRPLMRGTPA